jgi:hypothetical protein
MTLNITVLARDVIYQSADFRLSDAKTNKAYDDDPSTKAVMAWNLAWTGFITYTGVGRVGDRHTSDFVQEWLRNANDASFDEVVDRIRRTGAEWIRRHARGHRHTFVVAGFIDGVATAALISNFEQGPGRTAAAVSPDFAVTYFRARRRPEVLVTGRRQAVSRAARRRIARRVDQAHTDPARVRRELAAATKEAANLHPQQISTDCFVYSQDAEGRGQAEVFGTSRTRLPQVLPEGVDKAVQSFLDDQFGPGQWTLSGATYARSGGAAQAPDVCTLVTVQGEGGDYSLQELATPDGRRATPRWMNSAGIVVGEGAPVWQGPSYPCVWNDASGLGWLDHLGGLGGQALSVSDRGLIAGHCERPDRASVACLWRSAGSMTELESPLGRHSGGARAVNEQGDVAGWVSVHPTEGGQEHFRPALWPNGQPPVVLRDPAGRWGEAISIGADGMAVVRLHAGSEVEAALWDGHLFSPLAQPPWAVRAFYPVRRTSDGAVVGTVILRNHARGVAVCDASGEWTTPAGLPSRRELLAADLSGNLVGREIVDEYQVAWIWRVEGKTFTRLPYVRHHHTAPTHLAEDGSVLGTASSDNCSHPVRWLPT